MIKSINSVTRNFFPWNPHSKKRWRTKKKKKHGKENWRNEYYGEYMKRAASDKKKKKKGFA